MSKMDQNPFWSIFDMPIWSKFTSLQSFHIRQILVHFRHVENGPKSILVHFRHADLVQIYVTSELPYSTNFGPFSTCRKWTKIHFGPFSTCRFGPNLRHFRASIFDKFWSIFDMSKMDQNPFWSIFDMPIWSKF